MLPMPVMMAITVWFVVLTGFALMIPFPTRIDEHAHYSMIRAMLEHPALFPQYGRYVCVRLDELTQWSAIPNYINHPSLYYLLFAPIMALTSDPLPLRVVNVLISTLALAILVVAVHRRFPETQVPPLLFTVMAAGFPKSAIVGGMINNDNLAALAASALFAGLLGMPGQVWWIAAGLAIAGWTKLTAFIALAAVAGVWLAIEVFAGRIRLLDRTVCFVATGIAIGTIPYLFTFARTGHFVWVSIATWRVPIAQRVHLDFQSFFGRFLDSLVMKWPAAEWGYPYWIALAGLAAPLALAVLAVRMRTTRPLGIAYPAGAIVLFAIHLMFGWSSYREMGDLTIMQTRYYGVLWPGFALLATITLAHVGARSRVAQGALLAVCLSPTLMGGLVLAFI